MSWRVTVKYGKESHDVAASTRVELQAALERQFGVGPLQQKVIMAGKRLGGSSATPETALGARENLFGAALVAVGWQH